MTVATELAETTRRSFSSGDLRKRTIHLYRKFIRASPDFVRMYSLNMPSSAVKTKIRQEFERVRYVNDLSVSNIIYMKGQMEYQETMNFWKQQCHVLKYFKDEEAYGQVPKDDFVRNFLRNN